MLANHGSELKAVDLRHHDVDQHDRHVVLQQDPQRLFRRVRLDEVLAELTEDHLVAQELCRLVVDKEDVDLVHGFAAVSPGLHL